MSKNHNHRGWQYKEWRLKVLSKDNYRCQLCGSGRHLTVDHIKPLVSYPELKYEINNGRTLCNECRVKDMLEGWSVGRYKKGLS